MINLLFLLSGLSSVFYQTFIRLSLSFVKIRAQDNEEKHNDTKLFNKIFNVRVNIEEAKRIFFSRGSLKLGAHVSGMRAHKANVNMRDEARRNEERGIA